MKKNKKVKKKKESGVSFLHHDEIEPKMPDNWNQGLQFTNESVTPKKRTNKGKTGLVD